MRSNILSEAGLQTRLNQWWEGIPFLTSAVMVICGIIYLVCLLVGYDSFVEVCFLPSSVVSHFQVYRIYTAILFHGSLLHVMFNMMAMIPLGSELERIMGSIRLLYIIILLAASNAALHLVMALLVAHNPFHPDQFLMDQCSIGFSGILFSIIVIETSLSGVHSRSFFGLFNVPAKWYVWILLVLFQLMMTNVSFLGHLSGILSGYAYTCGLFNVLIPGTSFYSSIESSSWMSTCVRRPKFIVCTGNPSAHIPTYSSRSTTSSGLLSGNMFGNLSSWMPHRESPGQTAGENARFPGRGRALGSSTNQAAAQENSDSTLQTRLLDDVDDSLDQLSPPSALSNGRPAVESNSVIPTRTQNNQGSVASEGEIQKLVAMGFDRTQVEIALAAADGNLNVAIEILMSQQP